MMLYERVERSVLDIVLYIEKMRGLTRKCAVQCLNILFDKPS